jgi:cell division protein DivIC
MKLLNRIPSWLKNKYLLTAAGFIVWMLFFDDRDFITTHFRQRQDLRKLEQSRNYFQGQISNTQKELDQLKSNTSTIEKYAREKYHMKRDNEDLFMVNDK